MVDGSVDRLCRGRQVNGWLDGRIDGWVTKGKDDWIAR